MLNYVEVEEVEFMLCVECDCAPSETKMRYVYLHDTQEVRAYCADHYRAWMVAVHGEETVRLLEETGDYNDALRDRED